MTAKELEAEIKTGKHDEKTSNKLELVLEATKSLTTTIRSTLVEKEILREDTEKFLKHKKFRDELLSAIFDILEKKECPHHLRRSELELLINENTSIIEYKEVLNKIYNGLLYCICKDENNVDSHFMIQEILFNYIENVHKTDLKKSI